MFMTLHDPLPLIAARSHTNMHDPPHPSPLKFNVLNNLDNPSPLCQIDDSSRRHTIPLRFMTPHDLLPLTAARSHTNIHDPPHPPPLKFNVLNNLDHPSPPSQINDSSRRHTISPQVQWPK